MEEVLVSKTTAIATNIEKWKESLLDLSKRNQLVNFKYNKKRVLKINNDFYDFYEKLVCDEKIEDIEELDFDYDLKKSIDHKEFQAITKKLRKERNTTMNEKGVNILYLSFGIIAWKEHENATEKLHAPLLLLPVEIYQANRNTKMELRLFEDQLVVNPSLQYKFKSEYGIEIPDFESTDDIQDYMEQMEERLESLEGSQLLEEIYLSLLQFSKIALYKDMENYKDLIEEHPIVGSIASSQKVYDRETMEEIDRIDPNEHAKESFQVLDADSSQMEAIVAAKNGYSYVLQGPPGTGKSQTISNIISECIAKGQKVLFVSEKIAALNVVYKRLSQAGLGDYCLELHSNKSNKKNVITKLYDTYISNGRSYKADETLFDNVERLKVKMNNYVAALHKINEKYNETAYKMHGHLATLSDEPTASFSIPEKMDHFMLLEISSLLEQLSSEENGIAHYKQSVWTDLQVTQWSLAQETVLKEQLTNYLAILQQSNQLADVLHQQYELSVESFKQVLGILSLHEETGDNLALLVDEWLHVQNFDEQLSHLHTYYDDFLEQKRLEEKLLQHYSALQFPKISNTIKKESPIDEYLNIQTFYEQYLNNQSDTLITVSSQLQDFIGKQQTTNPMHPVFEVSIIDSYKSLVASLPFFELFTKGAKLPTHWLEDEKAFDEATAHILDDYYMANQFKQAQDQLRHKLFIEKLDGAIFISANMLKNIKPSMKEIYRYCYEHRNQIVDYMTKSIAHLENAQTIFDILRSKLNIHREANYSNSANLLDILDILPKIRCFEKEWFEGVGLKSVEREIAEFFELKDKILQSKKIVLEHWQAEIIEVFEDDSEIYNRFINQYSSVFSKLGGKYRADLKRVTLLLSDSGKVNYDTIVAKLKYVEQHYKLLKIYKENERSYFEFMGDLFDGLNTEKEDIQFNMQALRHFKELGELYGLTTIQMGQLLTLKNWFVTEFYDRGIEIKTALEYLKANYPKIHIQLTEHVNFETTSFEELKDTLTKKLALAKGLIQQIQAVETTLLHIDLTHTEFEEITLNILNYQQLLGVYESHFEVYEKRYGLLFNQMDTDWEELRRLISWWKDVRSYLFSQQVGEINQQAVYTFVQSFDKTASQFIHQTLQDQLKQYDNILEKLSSIVSHTLLNRLKEECFKDLQALISLLFERINLLDLTVDKLNELRMEKWQSVDQLVEEIEAIYSYEQLLCVMQRHADNHKSIVKKEFSLSIEGFEKMKQQLLFNQKFSKDVTQFDLTYNSSLLHCLTQLSKEYMKKLLTIKAANEQHKNYFESIFNNFDKHAHLPFSKHFIIIETMATSTYEIEKIVRMKMMFKQLSEFGLAPMIDKVLENEVLWQVNLNKLFLKRYYEVALDEVYSTSPELQNFDKENYEKIISLFKVSDIKQFEENAKRLNCMLSENLNEQFKKTMMESQLSILRKENEKKKRHLPLRQLFNNIPDLLLTLKPCVLMSPLSVCEFLNPRKIQFDLVVFDEASQICPEDAIAPMIRGRNIIMAGDSKQMPPTNFFKAGTSVDDEFDDELVDDELYESVLGLCSDLLPQKTLKWHYRSKHESLIAFSNRHFYNNSLYTFPSVDIQSQDLGVSFEYVENGYFDRSGSKTNQIEAERVAELIIAHYKNNSTLSLGVIAFSQSQMEAIEKKLEMKLRANPTLEKLINNESVEEPFFIKNLENVQGDERDVIFLSVGYAKDQNGVFYHQFGPLNKAGGERRLNVAITRAKQKLVLFSSIKDSEINLANTQSIGVKLLKNYLEYARTGHIPESVFFNSELEFDSPLEQDIYESIVSLGYDVKTQVGASGYRIDLAVINPKAPGKFLVGIECDGATYHSTKTARDRDRLRQQVLEGLGWKIYRIWSQDWFRNKSREIEKIKTMLAEEVQKQVYN